MIPFLYNTLPHSPHASGKNAARIEELANIAKQCNDMRVAAKGIQQRNHRSCFSFRLLLLFTVASVGCLLFSLYFLSRRPFLTNTSPLATTSPLSNTSPFHHIPSPPFP